MGIDFVTCVEYIIELIFVIIISKIVDVQDEAILFTVRQVFKRKIES